MIFGRIGRIFRSAFRVVTGAAMGFLTGGPFGAIMGAVQPLLSKALDKLGGLGKFLKPALGFLAGGGPLAFLAKGPMGLIGGMLDRMGLGQMGQFARQLMGGVGGHQNVDPAGILNLAKAFAFNQSRHV